MQPGGRLSATDVAKLKLKWAFNLGDVTDARTQPTVVDGRVYVASFSGRVFALDAASGCTRWSFAAEAPVRTAVVVGSAGNGGGRKIAVFGDRKANAYAVDASTGTLIWKVQVDTHRAAIITGSPQLGQGVVYVPVASFEEILSLVPKYECCTFRGSVVALDAATGKAIWKTYTIADSARPTTMSKAGVQERGPSGAAIWSAPTLDATHGVLYVATGNNYSEPSTNTSDAVLALDAKTGAIRWTKQMFRNDATNSSCGFPGQTMCPEADGPDADFGQPPILVTLPGGHPALLIAEKSGMAYALDPDRSGAVIWEARVAKGGKLGGSQWGSATDGRVFYVASSDLVIRGVPDSSPQHFHLEQDPTAGGGLTALDVATGQVKWKADPVLTCGQRAHCSPAQTAPVSVMPGVVFSASNDGHLRAYAMTTGAVVWDFDAGREFPTVNGAPGHGGSFNAAGVAVAGGMIYVSSGDGTWGGTPGNVLLAFQAQ